MQISFRTKQLERCYKEYRKAAATYGNDVAKKYVLRINIIKQAKNIDELMKFPVICCHPLKGDRAGQYALKLTGFNRLIFTLKGEGLEVAHIEEVSKHYDD